MEQRTNNAGWPKAGELIQMAGTHPLEASDRAILNILYQHAHNSGRMTDPTAEWEIPLCEIRPSSHQGNERLYESLQRLRRVEVTLSYYAPGKGNQEPEERLLLTGLFDFFDVSARELEKRATLRFGLPKKLAPLLARSDRWGRIKAEVVCAMTSKYAIALYETIQLRAHLDRCVETFPIERFREQLGVPPGAYENGTNFMTKVITPALLEVNGLSDVGVKVDCVADTPARRSPASPWRGGRSKGTSSERLCRNGAGASSVGWRGSRERLRLSRRCFPHLRPAQDDRLPHLPISTTLCIDGIGHSHPLSGFVDQPTGPLS